MDWGKKTTEGCWEGSAGECGVCDLEKRSEGEAVFSMSGRWERRALMFSGVWWYLRGGASESGSVDLSVMFGFPSLFSFF